MLHWMKVEPVLYIENFDTGFNPHPIQKLDENFQNTLSRNFIISIHIQLHNWMKAT